MEFNIADDLFRKLVPDSSCKRYYHGFGKRTAYELPGYVMQVTCERFHVVTLRPEAQSYGKFQKEAYMEIAEILLNGIKKHDVPFAPVKQVLVCRAVFQGSEQHFGHEHAHGILGHAASYSVERMS